MHLVHHDLCRHGIQLTGLLWTAPDDFQHFKFSDGGKLLEDGGHPPLHRLCDAGFWRTVQSLPDVVHLSSEERPKLLHQLLQ